MDLSTNENYLTNDEMALVDELMVRVDELLIKEEQLMMKEASQAENEESLLKKIECLLTMEGRPLINTANQALLIEALTMETVKHVRKSLPQNDVDMAQETMREIMVEEGFKLLTGVNLFLRESIKLFNIKVSVLQQQIFAVSNEEAFLEEAVDLVTEAETLIKLIVILIDQEPQRNQGPQRKGESLLPKVEKPLVKNIDGLVRDAANLIRKALTPMKKALAQTELEPYVRTTESISPVFVTAFVSAAANFAHCLLPHVKKEISPLFSAAKCVYFAALVNKQTLLYERIMYKITESTLMERTLMMTAATARLRVSSATEWHGSPLEERYAGTQKSATQPGNKMVLKPTDINNEFSGVPGGCEFSLSNEECDSGSDFDNSCKNNKISCVRD